MLSFLHRRPSEKGASLVEAAILVPLLLLILAGVADFGRAFHTYVTMMNAAREGARYGVNRPSDTANIENIVRREALGSDVDLSSATITVTESGPGNPIQVTVELDFPTILGGVIGNPMITIETNSVFRVRG